MGKPILLMYSTYLTLSTVLAYTLYTKYCEMIINIDSAIQLIN